jgi:putative Holliday junction resolvase
MALDVGEVRTGVALSDVACEQASPLKVLETKALRADNRQLIDLITDYEVICLVVGLPLQADGTPGQQARRTQSLTKQLLNGVDTLANPPTVLFFDERHSSADAKAQGHTLGLSERDMRGVLDSHAAAHFLQAYLDAGDNRTNNEE